MIACSTALAARVHCPRARAKAARWSADCGSIIAPRALPPQAGTVVVDRHRTRAHPRGDRAAVRVEPAVDVLELFIRERGQVANPLEAQQQATTLLFRRAL